MQVCDRLALRLCSDAVAVRDGAVVDHVCRVALQTVTDPAEAQVAHLADSGGVEQGVFRDPRTYADLRG